MLEFSARNASGAATERRTITGVRPLEGSAQGPRLSRRTSRLLSRGLEGEVTWRLLSAFEQYSDLAMRCANRAQE